MYEDNGTGCDPEGAPPLTGERAAAPLVWRTAKDDHGIDGQTLRQAAALATVVMEDGRPALGGNFGEFAEFIAEVPF